MRISKKFRMRPDGIPHRVTPTNHDEDLQKMNRKINHVWFLLMLLLVLPNRTAMAQVDLTGEWSPRVYNDGMDIGDYTGIPLNDAGRLRAESWHPEQLDLPENLCRPHPIDIGLRVSVS